MTSRNVSDVERDFLDLPARFGGLCLPNPSKEAPFSFSSASKVTQPQVEHLLLPDGEELSTALAAQTEAVVESRKAKNIRWKEKAAAVKERLDPRLQRAVDAAEDKGASSWLTALPIADLGFSLSKADFRDAIDLRFGWNPPRLTSRCVCGEAFTVDHSLCCSHGGYLGIRHSEVRDLLGQLLDETCPNVSLEPTLQPLSGEQLPSSSSTTQEARVDIKAGGFWSVRRHECAFFDVRVFHPNARSYRHRTIQQTFRTLEQEKRRAYETRIRQVDGGSFTPLVFTAAGGAGPAASVFLKHLGSKIAEKKDAPYSQTIGWLRCRLSFALLRASILCIRGSHSQKQADPRSCQPDLAVAEGCIMNI